ncbi:MAG: hypothetical protein FJZ04_00095 [Candidatus Moranbacteria bacterium]|nr:hypothetical protein [Candidatus Moranbacteria bacterium]
MQLLTKKEEVVLTTIKKYFAKKNKMPTIREILRGAGKAGIKVKSLASIFLYLRSLEDKGFIKRNSEDRGIILCDINKNKFISVPILGTANAGSPTFFAQENIEGYLKISRRLITKRVTDAIFAIQVFGNSMDMAKINDKRIEDGDYALVDSRSQDYGNGDKVLATIDGLATIKNFFRVDQSTIGLFPQSSEKIHKPIYLTREDNFIINGKIIDVLKTPAMAGM